MEKELVKIVSNNPAHPQGFYIQFKDKMKPGDVEYFESEHKQATQTAEPIPKRRKGKK